MSLDDLLITKSFYPIETKDGTKLLIDQEYDERVDITLITEIVMKISKTNKPPFYVQNDTLIQPTSAASRRLLNLLSGRYENLKIKHPDHTFNPYVELFYSVSEKWGLNSIKDLLTHQNKEHTKTALDILNQAAEEIQQATQGSDFKKSLTNRRRRYQKNKKSILTYIKSIFDQPNNSTLLIIRIDCAYKSVGNECSEVPYEAVRSHRRPLLRFLQSKFKDDYLGYVAKLEYGLKKRYHYHWIIILNGNRLRRDVAIGAIIGNHWNKEITQGKGVYFNCNANKNAYRFNCIGLVRHNSDEFWNGASKLAEYITKADYHLSATLPAGHRSLWRGEKTVQERSKRGRKRLPVAKFFKNQI